MSLDPKVKEAIQAAAQEHGQSAGLCRKLVAWLEAVNSGNEDVNDHAATDRRLEIIFEEVVLSDEASDAGDGEEEE